MNPIRYPNIVAIPIIVIDIGISPSTDLIAATNPSISNLRPLNKEFPSDLNFGEHRESFKGKLG